MPEVVWLEQAKDDVRVILQHIAQENPAAAHRYVLALEDAAAGLADFPLSGKRYNSRFRRIVFRNHLIFHRFDKDADKVLIVTVVDGRRDFDSMINEIK